MNAERIGDAIRGVLLGTLGSVRTVPVGTFGETVHSGTPDSARWIRAKVRAQADVRLPPPARTGIVGSAHASVAILAQDVFITITYAADATEDLIPDRRAEIRARAENDGRTVTDALEWPGNLEVDTSAQATGLVSGLLLESAPPRVTREDWTAGIYEVELALRGWVQHTRAIA